MPGLSLRSYYSKFSQAVSEFVQASDGIAELAIGPAVFVFLFVHGLVSGFSPVVESLISAGRSVYTMTIDQVYARTRDFARRTPGLDEHSLWGSFF